MITRKKVLITGATSGIGRETALKLAAQGVSLSLTGRCPEKLEALAAELTNPPQYHLAGDLTSEKFVIQLVSESDSVMGGFDAVVHCAGIGLIKPVFETTDAELYKVLNINLRVTYLVARETCKVMVRDKRGLFVTLPGILGKAPMRGAAIYAASKYGVVGLLKCMALELQRFGVGFTLLHLGGVDTPFWDNIEMKVDRTKMISASTASDVILTALSQPGHLVLNELTLQPESHQL